MHGIKKSYSASVILYFIFANNYSYFVLEILFQFLLSFCFVINDSSFTLCLDNEIRIFLVFISLTNIISYQYFTPVHYLAQLHWSLKVSK